ncbi:MAG: hypothetical protein HY606_06875 [Planctomycetes bacterium]|nr:hypothetical protein [Planctomycetota bacterium]
MFESFVEDIDRAYNRGELDQIKKDLEDFIVKNKSNLIKFKSTTSKKFKKDISTEDALKLYVLQARSINPTNEILDQLTNIKSYSEESNKDIESAGLSWANKFSVSWRDHRTTSIIYVFEKNKSHYLKLLENIEVKKD